MAFVHGSRIIEQEERRVCTRLGSKRDHRLPRPVPRSESAMIRRSIIDPRRRDRWDGATPSAKLHFHAANAITRSSAHQVFRCERVGAPRITRRVTIITRPQFIIQTLCTGSRVWPSTLIPARTDLWRANVSPISV